MSSLDTFSGEDAAPLPGGGFVIESIMLKDFMGYGSAAESVEFDNKFTVITGRTGSGKTTILDAVTYALFNRTSRLDIKNVKISDICRPGGYVELAFTQAGKRYTVRRGMHSKSKSFLEVRENGALVEGNISELGETLEAIIGLGYDGFRNATFVRQDEMKALGSEKPAERLAIFQKLFRLEVFNKAADVAGKRFGELRDQQNVERGKLDERKRSVEQMGELKEAMRDLELRITGVKEGIAAKRGSIDALKGEIESLRKEHDSYIERKTELDGKRERHKELEMRIKAVQAEARKGAERQRSIEALEGEITDFDRFQRDAGALRERARAANQLSRDIDERRALLERARRKSEERREKLEQRISKEEARVDRLSTSIDRDEAFGLLRTEGRLVERLERIERELEWLASNPTLVKELEDEREGARTEATSVAERVGGINEDSFALSEIKANIGRLSAELEQLGSEWKDEERSIEESIGSKVKELDALGFGRELERELKDLDERIKVLDGKRKELARLRRESDEAGDVRSLLREYALERDAIAGGLDELEKSVVELEKKDATFREKQRGLEGMAKDLEGLISEQGRRQQEMRDKEEALKRLERDRESIAELESEIENRGAQMELFAILKNQVFHRRGIPMYAIDRLLPQLEIESSEILADITNRRFYQVRLEHYDEGARYGVNINVRGVDGEWHDVAEFSGGERTQINAALRFAIARELASMPHIGKTYGKMRTLFIDEGDLGSLDTEVSRELFVNKLFEMGDSFDRIVLITHLDEVAERFPSRVVVEQGEGGRSRARKVIA